MVKKYLISCPRCHNEFKREIIGLPKGKKKVCPFCSKEFVVHRNLKKTHILGVVNEK